MNGMTPICQSQTPCGVTEMRLGTPAVEGKHSKLLGHRAAFYKIQTVEILEARKYTQVISNERLMKTACN